MPRAKRPDARMVNVQIDDALMNQIEDFRYQSRIPSRVEAIKTLVRLGLGKGEKRAKAPVTK